VTSLVPLRAVEGATYSNHAQIACVRGDVWAGIAFVTTDTAAGVATYAMRIANNSDIPLRARFRGRPVAADSDIKINAFSIFETLIPVRLALSASGPPASIDVEGDGVAFSLDVPSPAVPVRNDRSLSLQIALALCVLLFALTAVAALVAQRNGGFVGSSSAAAPAHRPVTPVRRVARRAVENDSAEPLLDDVNVSPLPARAGGTLRVAYATTAAAGDVWLLDLHGQVWAHAAIDPSGKVALQVPEAAAGHEMRVVVHARRGVRHAQTGVGITVLPSDGDVAALASGSDEPGPPVRVMPARATSGTAIHVVLAPGHGEALVSLTDASGSVLQEVDVPAGAHGSTTLTAPDVSAPATYDVVVTLSRGYSQEEVVKPVTVSP